MASSRAELVQVEEDVESLGGRNSEECDQYDQSKEPLMINAREITKFQSEDCPLCLRRARWRCLFSVLSLKGKQRAVQCPHDKVVIEDYLRKSRNTPSARKRRRRCRLLASLVLVVFALFGLWNMITLFIGLGPLIWDPSLAVDHFFPNWGLPGEPGEGLSGYPTDFTRDVQPIPCHSHNDYWRRIPLYEAIHYGCTGVEADVWLFDDELFVGHTTASLTPNRTFRSLYVDPIVQILDKQNPHLTWGASITPKRINGVFEESPSQTLVLLVDFKMDGAKQFPYVSDQLSALREKNYLTYFDGATIVPGAVTVVATGNAPFDLITANTTYRDIFFDAPLDQLSPVPTPLINGQTHTTRATPATAGQGNTGTTPFSDFSSDNSYYASLNFKKFIGFPYRGRLSRKQMQMLRSQIKAAHAKGLKARYWNTPTWPVGLRNHIWKVLVQEGADYLNVDDIKSARLVDWGRGWRSKWIGGI